MSVGPPVALEWQFSVLYPYSCPSLKPCTLNAAAVNELRRSHFITGDDVVDFKTSSGAAQAFSQDYSHFQRADQTKKDNGSHFEFTGQDGVPTSTVADTYQ